MAGIGWPGANCSQMRRASSNTCNGATAGSPDSCQSKRYWPAGASSQAAATAAGREPAQACKTASRHTMDSDRTMRLSWQGGATAAGCQAW
ncbi:Uncharacterised protein [Bordetella pertussis]|nr:Uncharacterised protein [Bordetella pertussis]